MHPSARPNLPHDADHQAVPSFRCYGSPPERRPHPMMPTAILASRTAIRERDRCSASRRRCSAATTVGSGQHRLAVPAVQQELVAPTRQLQRPEPVLEIRAVPRMRDHDEHPGLVPWCPHRGQRPAARHRAFRGCRPSSMPPVPQPPLRDPLGDRPPRSGLARVGAPPPTDTCASPRCRDATGRSGRSGAARCRDRRTPTNTTRRRPAPRGTNVPGEQFAPHDQPAPDQQDSAPGRSRACSPAADRTWRACSPNDRPLPPGREADRRDTRREVEGPHRRRSPDRDSPPACRQSAGPRRPPGTTPPPSGTSARRATERPTSATGPA